ncbi:MULTISPECIES: flagellar biosynthesis anti-sigma factor FlgM [Sediminispirochaeta]|jgi:negative regulator of flagellin synthesis FlgM|uniref:Anti-sigma-28 factor FlgM family protein n=1 Tax=Sediminispirochaeta smaragdinae (strain DSM 11293 / JCM 15392 / SEBR 4228) TaxID=573413 RepID=E1RAI1_SEDSS|nr:MULTISPECIES: flagellar biosynthesis anti-sigma factor FlgM [Sediminispirochaeta]ADK79472.1 Anti-sigma-28 factor FlgM family protein [Sediminispirochaeta smaragdinae DSM 11293]
MNIERLGPVDPVNKLGKTNKTSKPIKPGEKDSISISNDAKTMAEVYKAVETVKASPDIRADRVEEVRRKLEDPSYINDKLLGDVADSIMDMFGIS